jgi:hypothetical protein
MLRVEKVKGQGEIIAAGEFEGPIGEDKFVWFGSKLLWVLHMEKGLWPCRPAPPAAAF